MDVYPDLAANGPMREIIIKLLETIVRINNESDTGEKPSLNKLDFLLLFYWGIRQRFLSNQTFTILSKDTGTLR